MGWYVMVLVRMSDFHKALLGVDFAFQLGLVTVIMLQPVQWLQSIHM
jgi:hypothetical protein